MIRKIVRWAGLALAALVVLVAVAAAVMYAVAGRRFDRIYNVPDETLVIPADQAAIDRGEYLVRSIGTCVTCHGEDLGGFIEPSVPKFLGTLASPNITRGKGSRVLGYTARDWMRILRHGVRRDGRPALFMPSTAYNRMSLKDLGAIVAYVQQVPPVDRDVGPPKLALLGRIMYIAGLIDVLEVDLIDHAAPPPAPIPVASDARYGEYLVGIGSCRGCHKPDLAGGSTPGMPYAPNLTPAGPLAAYTVQDFIGLYRTGKRPDGRELNPAMPWKPLGRMTDEELAAIFLYLKSVPPKQAAE